ncbi:MAG: tRNA pseudouridine(55) synthase TruB [Candidatus Walczuchella monophlebidarum]
MFSKEASFFEEGKILLVDKPLGWTSFEVVKRIRWNICRFVNIKKIKVGHAGTLDPKATGLLIVCTGKATKETEKLQKDSKIYSGTLKLGATTPCYDSEMSEDKIFPFDHIQTQQIYETAKKFTGKIMQQPPIFSALQQEGKRLYKMARKGIKIETTLREVEIFQLEILSINIPYINFRVHCGKGTYIRSLVHNFGEYLQSGAYLISLRREQINGYTITDVDTSILTTYWQ